MSDGSPQTSQMLLWVERIQSGDGAVWDDLLRHVGGRLDRLTHNMLQGYPGVKRWEQTDDVLQAALIRLDRALREVRPASMSEFFGLAGLQIRRELLDLADHYSGPEGPGNKQVSLPDDDCGNAFLEPVDRSPTPSRLAEWCEVHRRVERLPEEEREAFNLLYYQGVTQTDAAALLGVSVRTIQRRWHSALLQLHDLLKEGQSAP
jgi:RNA polymerase sigma factor (sigma-70 family)